MNEDKDGINIWLAFSDLFAGMLIVFAVFYGIKLETEQAARKEIVRVANRAAAIMDHVAEKINERNKTTQRHVESRGLSLDIPSDITFESGKHIINKDAKDWLIEIGAELGESLAKLGDDSRSITIEIHGYTDAYPVKKGNKEIPTNWELSSRRASEILRLFQDNELLDPSKYHVIAVGEAEYAELPKNYDATGKLLEQKDLMALRRVQVRIVPNYEALLKAVEARLSAGEMK
jgi:chemotaxis protein MotB